MYDTIHLCLPLERAGNTDFLCEIPLYLSDYEPFENKKTGEKWINGHLGNFKININENRILFKGSIAKYYLGNNIETLTRIQTQSAIEKMSDEIHLPMNDAKVTRIDFASNLIVDHPPQIYCNYLGECRHFVRSFHEKTLYYENHQRIKTFYDKIKEVKKKNKGESISKEWLENKILRYELRFIKRLPSQFNRLEINVSSLYEEKFYVNLVDRLVEEYEKINKLRQVKFDSKKMKTPNDFIKQLAVERLFDIGQVRAMQRVDEMKKKFANSQNYYRLKRDITNLCKNPKYTDEPELIEELTNKVRAIKEMNL